MRIKLLKSKTFNQTLDMIYMASDGSITKRRIKVLEVNEESFQAYCFLRRAKRTFRIDNVLALVPVVQRESMVI